MLFVSRLSILPKFACASSGLDLDMAWKFESSSATELVKKMIYFWQDGRIPKNSTLDPQ